MTFDIRTAAPLLLRTTITFAVVAAVAVTMLEAGPGVAVAICAATVALAVVSTALESRASAIVEAAWPFVAALLFLAESKATLVLFFAAALQLAAAAVVVMIRSRDGELPLFPAAAIFGGVLAWRFVGATGLAEETLVVLGCVALFAAVAKRTGIRIDALAVLVFVVASAPSGTLRAATIPLVIAVTFAAFRLSEGSLRWILAVVATLVSLAAGKWALLIGIASFAPLLATKLSADREPAMMPSFAAGGIAALRGLLLDPLLFLRAARSPLWRKVVAVVWLLAAVTAERPQLGISLLLAAALLIATDQTSPARRGVTPLAVAAGALFLLFPWSAASLPLFPYAASLPIAAGLVFVAVLASGRLPFVRNAIAAGMALLLLSATQRPILELHDPGVMLKGGDSYTVPLSNPARELDLVLSGADVAALAAGTKAGWIDLVAADGSGRSREVVIGDLADWGAWRREQIFSTHNPLLRAHGGEITGIGRSAVLRGSGRIRVESEVPLTAIRLRVGDLPPGAGVMFERAEVLRR